MVRKIALIIAACFVSGILFSQTLDANKKKAEALVKKAVAFYQANGEAKALAAYNDKKGQFVEGDYYIFAYNMTGVCIGHGLLPEKIGKNWIEQKDIDGKLYILDIVKTAKTDKGEGAWTSNYKTKAPTTGKIQSKTSFVMKIPGKEILVGCGIYIPDAK